MHDPNDGEPEPLQFDPDESSMTVADDDAAIEERERRRLEAEEEQKDRIKAANKRVTGKLAAHRQAKAAQSAQMKAAPDLVPTGEPGTFVYMSSREAVVSSLDGHAVRWVPASELKLEWAHWVNPRLYTGLDADSLAELATSIQREARSHADSPTDRSADVIMAGIREPLTVVPIGHNGRTVQLVIDGQRRHRATVQTLGGDALVPVVWLEAEPIEWTASIAARYLRIALEGEATRVSLGNHERVEAAVRLRRERNPDTGADYTLREIGGAIGRHETWVSKMLTAHSNASAKQIHAWRSGLLTDEQFKDLAHSRAADDVTDKVTAAAKSGDKAAARAAAKEAKELKVNARKAKATAARIAKERKAIKAARVAAKKATKAGKLDDAGQASLPRVAPGKPPAKAVIEALLSDAARIPPTADIAKGIILGIQYATGAVDPADFPTAWHKYMRRFADR